MRTNKVSTVSGRSASRLQKGSVMKAMRVMILAAVALTACGPGGEDEGAQDGYATTERAITQGCEELNCQEQRMVMGPGGTTSLPQDPVPLHTGRTPSGAAADADILKPR
jgi:hypothetical protein